MKVLGAAAAARIGRAVAECEHVELYSCFPLAVRVQQRELGLEFFLVDCSAREERSQEKGERE